jgi:hypothetical protein
MENNLYSNFLSKSKLKDVTDWEQAISAGESLLDALQKREKAIKKSVESLKKLRDSNVPFPEVFRSTLGKNRNR